MIPRAAEDVLDSYLDQRDQVATAAHQPLPRPRLSEAPEDRTRDLLHRKYQQLTVLDLLLAGVAACDVDELGHVGHLSAALIPARDLHARITLPDGREVASLHTHLSRWRHAGLIGFTTTETPLSSRLQPPLTRPRGVNSVLQR